MLLPLTTWLPVPKCLQMPPTTRRRQPRSFLVLLFHSSKLFARSVELLAILNSERLHFLRNLSQLLLERNLHPAVEALLILSPLRILRFTLYLDLLLLSCRHRSIHRHKGPLTILSKQQPMTLTLSIKGPRCMRLRTQTRYSNSILEAFHCRLLPPPIYLLRHPG